MKKIIFYFSAASVIGLFGLISLGCKFGRSEKSNDQHQTKSILLQGGWKSFGNSVYLTLSHSVSKSGEGFEFSWLEADGSGSCAEYLQTWNGRFKEEDLVSADLVDSNYHVKREFNTYLRKPKTSRPITCELLPKNITEITETLWNSYYYEHNSLSYSNISFGGFRGIDLSAIQIKEVDPIYFGTQHISLGGFNLDHPEFYEVDPIFNIVEKKIVGIYLFKLFLLEPEKVKKPFNIVNLSSYNHLDTKVHFFEPNDLKYSNMNREVNCLYGYLSDEESNRGDLHKSDFNTIFSNVIEAVKNSDIESLKTKYSHLIKEKDKQLCGH